MAKNYTYTIGLQADTVEFKRLVETALNSLQEAAEKDVIGKSINTSVEKAISDAKTLKKLLQEAGDPTTGKFNLGTFEQSLRRSGQSLSAYQESLKALGVKGTEAFNDVAKAISMAEAPLKRSSKLVDDLWITLKNTVRWQAANKIVNTFAGGIETAYNYSKDLDRSLNNIRIVTGLSAEEMSKFAAQANEAARNLSTTTTDYTNAALIYALQGLRGEEITERTDITVKSANVTGLTAETVSEQLTAIWNNFYNGSKSLEYYVDVMNALGATTASSSAEIANGIQKFAAVTNTIGLSYEYAAAALATLVANTREAPETVGNSLKTLFSRIQGLSLGETQDDGTDLTKYSKALLAVGVNIKDVNGELKSMDTILNETHTAWETLSQDQKMALAQTVAGKLLFLMLA